MVSNLLVKCDAICALEKGSVICILETINHLTLAHDVITWSLIVINVVRSCQVTK